MLEEEDDEEVVVRVVAEVMLISSSMLISPLDRQVRLHSRSMSLTTENSRSDRRYGYSTLWQQLWTVIAHGMAKARFKTERYQNSPA